MCFCFVFGCIKIILLYQIWFVFVKIDTDFVLCACFWRRLYFSSEGVKL